MNRSLAVLRGATILLTGFLALTAVPGGISLLAGVYAPPVQQLEGTIFPSFLVPGLALLVIVGGGAVVAFVLLVRGSRLAPVAAGLSGACVMTFEFVEVLAIGSPPGPAFFMQVFYFGIGLVLVCLALLFLRFGNDVHTAAQRQP